MGQKVNPHGLRVGVIKDWDSRWYAREEKVGDLIVEDHKIRQYLKKALFSAGVPTIEIERDSAKVRLFIHCSRPGVVIGKGGAEIERLQNEVSKMIGKPVAISIIEVRTPDTNAQLVAENIAQQLEKRIGFRRAMKNAMGRAMRMDDIAVAPVVDHQPDGPELSRRELLRELQDIPDCRSPEPVQALVIVSDNADVRPCRYTASSQWHSSRSCCSTRLTAAPDSNHPRNHG